MREKIVHIFDTKLRQCSNIINNQRRFFSTFLIFVLFSNYSDGVIFFSILNEERQTFIFVHYNTF